LGEVQVVRWGGLELIERSGGWKAGWKAKGNKGIRCIKRGKGRKEGRKKKWEMVEKSEANAIKVNVSTGNRQA